MLTYILFCVIGLLAVIVCLIILHFRANSCGAQCYVVCLSGDAAAVEMQIRSCLHRQKKRSMVGKLLFVDRGLDPEGIMAAQILLARETEAILCAPDQALEYIKWEIDQFGAGTD